MDRWFAYSEIVSYSTYLRRLDGSCGLDHGWVGRSRDCQTFTFLGRRPCEKALVPSVCDAGSGFGMASCRRNYRFRMVPQLLDLDSISRQKSSDIDFHVGNFAGSWFRSPYVLA